VAGRQLNCRAQLLEPGTAARRPALDAYRERYPRLPVGDATPVLVLTPGPLG